MREAALQLHAHDGPYFKYWRRRLVAGLGGVIAGEEPLPPGRFRPVLLDDDGFPT